ncbi:MAG: hypothetical protein HZA34_04735 [Candidatus Pacebacteria bacterium]|nr:hypothetical protein [Candidatus Paceibacterota bacterium]
MINILTNTELLLTHFSQGQWLEWAKKHQKENIFFGVGIMTHRALSEAIPFDILMMFFIAELLRRVVSAKKVVILVADQHAITNQLASIETIQNITEKTLAVVRTIIQNFRLSHFECIRTTTLNSNDDIRTIFRNLPDISNDYLKHEIADSLWLQKFHHVGIKLGWAMSREQNIEGHDERFFDLNIAKFCPTMSFIHTKSGRTANPERSRVSPYVSIHGEDRLLLRCGENATKKIFLWRQRHNQTIKPLLRQLSQIVRLYDKLFQTHTFQSFDEKMQHLIELSTITHKKRSCVDTIIASTI